MRRAGIRWHSTLHVRESLRLNQAIADCARQPPPPLALDGLVRWRRAHEPREAALLRNAATCLGAVRHSLARTLDALRDLPLIVALNPHVAHVYRQYYHSFEALHRARAPVSASENAAFVHELKTLMGHHADTVAALAKGFGQSRELLAPERTNAILLDYLHARIGMRTLAEHHVNLTEPPGPNFAGAVQLDLCPAEMVFAVNDLLAELTALKFGFTPRLRVELGRDVVLAYPPGHLEYILTELIKNSFWALCQRGEEYAEQYPVLVTIIRSGPGILIRIRDMGGGIAPEDERNVFKFSFSNVARQHKKWDDDVDSSLAGLGYGLPLSKLYAEFFGGHMQLQSYFGSGVDAYVTLPSPQTSIRSEQD